MATLDVQRTRFFEWHDFSNHGRRPEYGGRDASSAARRRGQERRARGRLIQFLFVLVHAIVALLLLWSLLLRGRSRPRPRTGPPAARIAHDDGTGAAGRAVSRRRRLWRCAVWLVNFFVVKAGVVLAAVSTVSLCENAPDCPFCCRQ